MRSLLYVGLCATVTYFFVGRIYRFFYAPLYTAVRASGGKVHLTIAFQTFTEAFFVYLQIAVICGLIIASPIVMLELWGFIRPALTPKERKPLRWVVPFSTVLFVLGVALAYWVARFAMVWFLGYISDFPDAVLYQNPKTYILFMLKLMGAFGLVFQLPVVLMFLAWVGILHSDTMRRSWRHAIVGISVVGMVVTPSNDAFTMLIMIIPVIFLYVGSIWLVKLIERKRERDRA
jgi:sec-independent protein translocase protein TatC